MIFEFRTVDDAIEFIKNIKTAIDENGYVTVEYDNNLAGLRNHYAEYYKENEYGWDHLEKSRFSNDNLSTNISTKYNNYYTYEHTMRIYLRIPEPHNLTRNFHFIKHRVTGASYYKKHQFNIHTDIKNVIFNDPATIVFWTDGTKTVVKCENEDYDPEKGLAMAISKKVLGNKGNYYETFKKWLPEKKELEDDSITLDESDHICCKCKYYDVIFIAEPCFTCKCSGCGEKDNWEAITNE